MVLPKKPELQRKCCGTIAKYIREKYGSTADDGTPTLTVDAIVAPDTKGFIVASIVAWELDLPFLPIRKAKKLLADPDDLETGKFKSRRNKVSLSHEIYRSVAISIIYGRQYIIN